jgi:hypothetical protein
VTQPAAPPDWVDALRWQLLPLLRQQTGIRWDTRAQLNLEAWLAAAGARGWLGAEASSARGAVRSILCKSAREQAAFDAVFEAWLAKLDAPAQSRASGADGGAGEREEWGAGQARTAEQAVQGAQAARARRLRRWLWLGSFVLLLVACSVGYYVIEERAAVALNKKLALEELERKKAADREAARLLADAASAPPGTMVWKLQVVPPTPAQAASAAAASGLAVGAALPAAPRPAQPAWFLGVHPALVAALLALAASAGFAVRRTRQQFIQRITTRENLREQEVFARQLLPVSGTRREGLRRAVRLLRQPEPSVGRDLDVLASVRASATRAGLFTAVHRQRTATPAYLVLVDRLRAGDQQAHWAIEAARDLADEGVPLALYEFDRDPRWVAPLRLQRSKQAPLPQAYVALGTLAARHAGQGLLVLADGQGLLDHATGRLHTWLAPALAAWPRRVLMTPRPMAAWGAAEDLLAGEQQAAHEPSFLLVPSQFDAWLAAARWLRQGAITALSPLPGAPTAWPPLLAEDAKRWLGRSAPAAPEGAALVEQLRAYLGPTAYTWLAASAAYPLLSAELTSYLAHCLPDPAMPVLTGEIDGSAAQGSAPPAARGVVLSAAPSAVAAAAAPPTAAPLVDARLLEARLVAIAQLPWCRHGLMPDWLRRQLLLSLPQSTRRQVREVMQQLFATAADAQQGSAGWSLGSVATGLPAAPGAAQPPWWRAVRQRIGMAGVLEQEPANSPLRDVIYLGLLRGEFDNELNLQATEEYARAAHADEAPPLSRNPLRWLAAGVLSLWFALRWLGWLGRHGQVAAAQGRARAKALLASTPTALPTQAPTSNPLSNDSSPSAAAPTPAETLVEEVAFAEEAGDKVQAVMETNSEPLLESMLESMTESVAEGPDLATPATRKTLVHPSPPQVFISYQRGDRETAVKLYSQLERRFPGQVFIDLAAGEPEEQAWRAEIQRALRAAAVVLVLINGASLPRASALPPSLRALLTRQALTLPERGFEQAVELMANELVQWLRPPTGSSGTSEPTEHK